VEEIDELLEMAETMMLGLRLVQEGVRLADFRERFGQELMAVYGGEIREMGQVGLLEVDGERVRLTVRGRLLGNEVFQRFLPESTV
jgi:oxygen-independent coproporphyrinogen-3 oxidase